MRGHQHGTQSRITRRLPVWMLGLSLLVSIPIRGLAAQLTGPVQSEPLRSWRPAASAHQPQHLQMNAGSRKTYKAEGVWIGFGLGLIATPFAWSACNHSSGGCSTQAKLLYAAGLPMAGGALGWLIGSSITKGD